MISLNIEKTFGFISKEKVFAYEAEVKAAQEMLEKGTGKGNDFLGWLHLPSSKMCIRDSRILIENENNSKL